MTDVTRILSDIEAGNPQAAEQLLPLVYEELRKLAAHKLAREKSGQTLQATALVHEAYLRLVGGEPDAHWNSRGHFFAAAAEAMRRILVDNARRKKHRGSMRRPRRCRIDLSQAEPPSTRRFDPDALLDLDELLTRLSQGPRTPRPRPWPSSGSSRACRSRSRRRPCRRLEQAPTASGAMREPGSTTTPGSGAGPGSS